MVNLIVSLVAVDCLLARVRQPLRLDGCRLMCDVGERIIVACLLE